MHSRLLIRGSLGIGHLKGSHKRGRSGLGGKFLQKQLGSLSQIGQGLLERISLSRGARLWVLSDVTSARIFGQNGCIRHARMFDSITVSCNSILHGKMRKGSVEVVRSAGMGGCWKDEDVRVWATRGKRARG